MDCTAHLEHLQTVFRKFNDNMVISKPVLIQPFCNSLHASICAQAKLDGH